MKKTYAEFLFHIESKYFPGYEIIKPFYATVSYSFNDKGFISVNDFSISIETLKIIHSCYNLANDVTSAAVDHYLKHYAGNDDLKGLFEPSLKKATK